MRLDSTVGRAHVSAAGAPKHQGADPARGRSRGGFGTQIHSLADLRGRPLRLRVTGGPRHDRTQARSLGKDGTDAPLPCLIADRAGQRRLPRLAGATGHQGRHSGPARTPAPPAPRPGTVPGAQGRGMGPRRAQTRAPRGHPLRQTRAAVPGFSVPSGGLALAETLNQHALDHGGNIVIDINIATNFDIYDHRGHAELIGHLLLVSLGIIVTQPLYDS